MSPADFTCRSIELGGKLITLTAKTVHKYICEWHLDTFVNAIFLGTPRMAIKAIVAKMDNAGEIIDIDQIIDGIDQPMVKAVPPLKVFTTECNVAITDFVTNNISGSQKFGIGLQIHDNNHIGPVIIDGVAFLVTLRPEANIESQIDRT